MKRVETPIGTLAIEERDGALRRIDFVEGPGESGHAPGSVAERLLRYFAGELEALDGIRVAPEGTSFQRRVWQLLREIPVGETRSYGQLARALGSAGSSRAVGAANGRNPIPIVVPCHRVVGADGKLVGFGGGLWRKEWLLRHERGERQLTSWGRDGPSRGTPL